MRGMEKILIKVILGLGAINLFNTIREHGYTPTSLTIRVPQEDASTDKIGHLKMHQIGMKNSRTTMYPNSGATRNGRVFADNSTKAIQCQSACPNPKRATEPPLSRCPLLTRSPVAISVLIFCNNATSKRARNIWIFQGTP